MVACAEMVLVWNTAMNLCSLPLGGKLAGLPLPQWRSMALASALGAGATLMCAPLGLLSLPCAVLWCFHDHGLPACLRCTLMTLCASFLTGGAMNACLSGGMAAASAGFFTLALSMAVYLLLNLLPQALCDVRQVELRVEERSIILPAMLDSGNLLRDPITNLPVLVIPARAARTLFPDLGDPSSLAELPLGFRLLSVRTAAGSALLPMFRPDECRIYVNGRACKAQLLAAVAGQEYRGVQALVPMAALPA